MHNRNTFSRRRHARKRRGGTIVLLAILLPVALAIASYAINIVYMELTRTELQITTDVATRAAGRVLAVTGDKQAAIDAAERMLSLNPLANDTVPLSSVDIVFGVSTRSADTEKYLFTPGGEANAVSITSNGSLRTPMLFPTMGMSPEFRPVKRAISTRSVADIALVLDRSGSMAFAGTDTPTAWTSNAPAPADSRWADVVVAVEKMLGLLEESYVEEQVGLITYSDKAKVDVSLTEGYADVSNAMAAYSARFPGGNTNIGDGIVKAVNSLGNKSSSRPWASRVMIVMSDGKHNAGVDPLVAAQMAAQEEITIYSITVSDEADIGLMQQVASIGAGKHFHALTGDELLQAFESLTYSLPTLVTR